MPTTYTQRSETSDLSGGGEYSRKLLEGTATVSDLVIALGISQTKTGHSYTEPGVPGAAGVTGNYSVQIDIAVGDNQVLCSAAVGRVNSSGTLQSESAFSAEQTAAGTVLTFNFSAVNLGTWVAGDRLRVAYRYRNQHAHTARNITVSFNTNESEVVTPWTFTVTHDATATLTGAGDLTAGATRIRHASATLTGAGALTATGIVEGVNPSKVLNLTATAVSTSQIDLSWDPVTGAVSYQIERDAAIIEEAHTGSEAYEDTGLAGDTEYSYRVRARMP